MLREYCCNVVFIYIQMQKKILKKFLKKNIRAITINRSQRVSVVDYGYE